MKSKNLVLTIICVCAISVVTYAQDAVAFKVLINKGKSEVKGGAGWQPVKTGLALKANEELKVPANAYVGLIHSSGRPMEIKEAGTFKVSDLAAKVGAGSSVMAKYTDFILSSNDPKKNNQQATGAVTRGIKVVDVYLPEHGGIIYNNTIRVNWDKQIAGPYVVHIMTMFEDELAKIETADNFISIDLGDKMFANEDNIQLRVVPKSDPSKASANFGLKRMSKSDEGKIRNELSLIAGPTAEETALNKLILAGFYEQNNLYIDAATAYQDAIRLAPDVTQFQDDYNNFLTRTALKEKQQKN